MGWIDQAGAEESYPSPNASDNTSREHIGGGPDIIMLDLPSSYGPCDPL
jgi:hypothetical protein